MIFKYFPFFCCLLFFLNLNAQDFGGGGKLGVSTSQVGGDDLAGFNKAGIIIGVFANKKISPFLSFQAEMTYIQKGSNNPNMSNNNHSNYLLQDISLSYIEIPLFLQYHQNKVLKIESGVQIAYLINGYYNDLIGKIPNEINPFIDYDIGLLIGMDYKYSNNISLNTRISNSILPIGKEDQNSNTYNSITKGKYNSVLSFTLNYNF